MPLEGRTSREFVSKNNPRKQEGVGEDVFRMWVYFSLSCSDWLRINWTHFPWIKPILSMTVIGDWSLPVQPTCFHYIFSPLCSWRGQFQSSFGRDLAHLARVNSPQTFRDSCVLEIINILDWHLFRPLKHLRQQGASTEIPKDSI